MKRIFLLLPILFILSQCSHGDSRVLGTIENKSITVDEFLQKVIPKNQIENFKKNPSMPVEKIFKEYATLYVLAHKGDKEKFFDKPEIAATLKAQQNQVKGQTYMGAIQDFAKKEISNIKVSDSDLAPYKKRVQVRHILFPADAFKKAPEKTKKLMQDVLDQIKKGVPFADLAKKYSQDPGSAKNGGLIEDWIYTNSPLVPEFKKAALAATKEKQVIPNVKTSFGTHIIYIEAIQNRKDISELKKSDPAIEQTVLREKQQKYQEELMKKIEDASKDKFKIVLDDKQIADALQKNDKNDKTVVATAKGIDDLTVSGLLEQIAPSIDPQNNLSQAQWAKKIKSIPAGSFERAVNQIYIQPYKSQMFAEDKGLISSKEVETFVENSTILSKGVLYSNDLVKKDGPKLEKMPSSVSDSEINNYYKTNKDVQYTHKSKTGKKIVQPLNSALKKEIKNTILRNNMRKYQMNAQKQQQDFIDKQTEPLFKEYGITFKELKEKKK